MKASFHFLFFFTAMPEFIALAFYPMMKSLCSSSHWFMRIAFWCLKYNIPESEKEKCLIKKVQSASCGFLSLLGTVNTECKFQIL